MTNDEPTDDPTPEGDNDERRPAGDPHSRVPRTTTTGVSEKDYRQKDDGANSEFRAHGRRGPYQDVDSDDHAWDPPEAEDDA